MIGMTGFEMPDGALSDSDTAYVADHADALRQRVLAMPS
jgi:hypothetical protein